MKMKTQPQRLLEAIVPHEAMRQQEPHDFHIFEEREARRDAWDEAEERRRDLEHESRVDFESWEREEGE
jgi:hypothetical protein